jgi:hypothetical protein
MKKKKESIIAISVIVAILAAGMVMGCIEKEVTIPISNEEFKNITADALYDVAQQLEDIEAAQDKGDSVTAKTILATLDASLVEYISIFEEMEVAENTLPCKKALILTFEETRILGVYASAYLESLTIEDYLRYGVQSEKVATQAEIGLMLSKNL